jgi:CspA family cold shock protein
LQSALRAPIWCSFEISLGLAVSLNKAPLRNTPNPDTGLAQMVARVKTRFRVSFQEINMATGTVKFFNGQKGFGFIAQDGGGPDVFVHVSAVERAGMRGLAEGQKITFDIEADRKSGKSAATNLQAA